ncbi:hypothetical protein [Blastococcus brunescens]|uniref:Uncharacterized protein n=1 Tax=Blastococcus brunescens TaxID=1564165 RepID=A0ABZ1AXC1_9ACTN|nr:hypothetical protein [Blastococcus sp. BMG 8361]WRL62048.1 hypothetical protein U6N30_18495 [Blastococcus sp. BMG 8361]
MTVHHHPSTNRHNRRRRQAGIARSQVLTAVMRHPGPQVARVVGRAVRSGRPGLEGLARSLPDLPAALRRRRPSPSGCAQTWRSSPGRPCDRPGPHRSPTRGASPLEGRADDRVAVVVITHPPRAAG